MKYLIALICSFLIITTPTTEQETFEKTIKNNYEEYFYVISDETVVGDIVIAVGKVKNNLYVSGFIYNNTKENYVFELNNQSLNNVFYKEKLTDDFVLKITTEDGKLFTTYEIENITMDDFFMNNLYQGNGKNKFPKEAKTLDIIDVFSIGVVLFVALIGLFTIILFYLYRNKLGLFNKQNYQNEEVIHNQNVYTIDETNYTVEKEKTKEELMQEAYDDYNNGKITENELNNRLRRIWWNEDD